MAIWQGDFGTGQFTGSGIYSDPGINPCRVYGPLPAATSTGSGYPAAPPFRVGMESNGDYGADFILCKLVLASVTDLLPGQVYFWDKDWNLTLLSTTNATNILQAEVGVMQVFYPQAPVGTYYAWLQRAGHAAVQAIAGSVATGSGETNATTAGALKFPAAATAAQKSVSPATAFVASSGVTFVGNTTNGSPTITGVTSINDLQLGMAITGTNLPANAIVVSITKTGNTWSLGIGTNTAGSYTVAQNATGTASGTTFTVTNMVTTNLYWPTLAKQN